MADVGLAYERTQRPGGANECVNGWLNIMQFPCPIYSLCKCRPAFHNFMRQMRDSSMPISSTMDAAAATPREVRVPRNSNSNVTYFVNCFFACSVAESSAEYTAFYNGRMGSRIEVAYKQERISRIGLRKTDGFAGEINFERDEWRPVKRLINDPNVITIFHKNAIASVARIYAVMPCGACVRVCLITFTMRKA